MKTRLSLKLTAAPLYLFLYAPIFVVVLYSFNAVRFGLAWQGFTTRWYRALAEDEQAKAAIKNTLLLAIFSTVIATMLGTMLGYGLARFKFKAARWLDSLLYIPVFIPDVVMAVALLLFYALLRKWLGGFELGLTTMTLAHVTFQIPFVAIVVRARLHGLDPALEEAARDLGAGEWQTLRHITLPLMFPGILAAGMLAFTLSLDDFVVSFFTSGPGSTTLPILIYSSLKRGITPEINALSSLIVAASILGAVTVMLFQRRHEQS
ncbi:MAG TPA: ABC transporter permease [Candidatus Saccharimonadales bacterium]|nr:ABC transporter permease [Candidatus Saccharimonadales bacterium]